MSARARAASPSNGAEARPAARRWHSNVMRSCSRIQDRSNVDSFGVRVDIRGAAPEAFDGAPEPAAIFIGGGLTQPGLLDACYRAAAARWSARCQRRHRRVGSSPHTMVFATGRRVAAIPALPRRGAGQVHRLASRYARDAVGGHQAMTVYFIGAGPGAADLITVRGQRLLTRCPVCLYAGSIMPDDLLALCPPDARVIDTGPLDLDQIIGEIADAHTAGLDVARLHSGDPSLYSAVAEQCRRLDALGIDYEIVPGVPAFAAAAAVLGRELTVPGVAQTVTLTRVSTLSTAMPPGEDLETLSAPGATLVLHLAAAQAEAIVPQLLAGGYRAETPCAVVAFASWPQQIVVRCTLGRTRRRDAHGRHHQDGSHRGGRRAGRRGLRGQLPVLVRTGAVGGREAQGIRIDACAAAWRHRGGPSTRRAAVSRCRGHQLTGRAGAGPALPVGEVRIGGFRWCRRDAALAHRFRCGRGRGRNASLRRHHHRTCRRGVWRVGASASGAGSTRMAARRCPILVKSAIDAAKLIGEWGYSRVFLTTGRTGVVAFRDIDAWFLIRAVTAPDPQTLPRNNGCCCRAARTATTTSSPCSPSTESIAGDEEQRWRHDPAEARCRRRTRRRGGDGGSASHCPRV